MKKCDFIFICVFFLNTCISNIGNQPRQQHDSTGANAQRKNHLQKYFKYANCKHFIKFDAVIPVIKNTYAYGSKILVEMRTERVEKKNLTQSWNPLKLTFSRDEFT